MAEISEAEIQKVVADVLRSLGKSPGSSGVSVPVTPTMATSGAPGRTATFHAHGDSGTPIPSGEDGVFERMEDAAEASAAAFREYRENNLEDRRRFVAAIRQCGMDHAEDLARRVREETGMGRLDHKIRKHIGASQLTPGVEDLESKAWSGDRGLTVVEMAPFGVIGAVMPSTHPTPTLISNSISMLSGGNVVCVAPHPSATRVSAYCVQKLNRAIVAAGGPRNLITTVAKSTMETTQALFTHPKVRLLVVTGGPGVVKAAMATNKKAIVAGPGNPPVVVDETADLKQAARDTFTGATFDNNILCIGEKEVFVVESVAEEFKRELIGCGSYELSNYQIEELSKIAFGVPTGTSCTGARLNRDLVGRDASVLAKAIGLTIDPSIELLIGETSFEHVFVQEEQMMPFLPIVRCRNVDEAIEMAFKAEHGFGHTAIIHSRNVANMTKMGKKMNTTIFVKNGPSFAGDGMGGEGFMSYSIATPTGEGITSTRTFTRQRRCTLVDYLRIV